jgi:hypothetical protein
VSQVQLSGVEVRHLQALQSVAEEGSFRVAADRLGSRRARSRTDRRAREDDRQAAARAGAGPAGDVVPPRVVALAWSRDRRLPALAASLRDDALADARLLQAQR